MSVLDRIVSIASSLLRDGTRGRQRRTTSRDWAAPPSDGTPSNGTPSDGPAATTRRAGGRATEQRTPDGATGAAHTTVEYTGTLPPLVYEPRDDEHADPGEVVWAWVPYEENDGRGKDRPVLVIARHPHGSLGLQAISKDHDRDRDDEARWGRYWFDIGSGAWDSQGRESEVRLDRVLLMPAEAVRREGASLPRDRFDAVVAALLPLHP